MSRLVGAVLIGGGSRRMGTDKSGMIAADGRALVRVVADALRELCDGVVALGAPPDCPDGVDAVVRDRRAGLGPLAGIDALLASGRAERYLICPCDLPNVTAASLAPLAASTGSIAVLRVDGHDRAQPLPMAIDAALAPIVTRQLDHERYAVRDLLDVVDADVTVVPAEWSVLLANANTPADAARLGLTPGESSRARS